MASESLSIDPTSEDAANVAFDLHDSANGINLLEHSYPAPDRDPMTAGSADTEGDPYIQSRYRNRQITAKVRFSKSTASALDTVVGQLESKVGKLAREGGTLKRTLASGNVIVFDVLDCDIDVPSDFYYVQQNDCIVTLTFTCKPFGRGAEDAGTAFSWTGAGSVTIASIKGDVPALGRALIIEGGTADQWHAHWGVRSRYYNSGTTHSLYYEAETLLPQGGAAAAALSGASGGTAVLQGTLTTSYQSMLSFAKASGTVYPQHIGDYNVWARLYRPTTNAGTVSVRCSWSEGDFTRFTTNTAIVYNADDREGDFTLANLGQVHLSKVKKGSQRWDGHIEAKSSTLGDDLYVDRVWFQPVTEGAGEVAANSPFSTPTSFSARDEFDQSAGNLSGKTAPIGGNWTTSGAATDLAVETSGHTAQRSTTSDGSARLASLTLSSYTDQVVSLDFKWSAVALSPLATYAYVRDGQAFANVSGSASNPALTIGINGSAVARMNVSLVAGVWYTLRVLALSNGILAAFLAPAGSSVGVTLVRSDSRLATGGTYASGTVVSFSDQNGTATACTRNYDNFAAYVPTKDAAVFSLKQAELRSDSFVRQDSAGTVWAGKTVEGDYLTIPASGREARTAEFFLRLSRGDPDTMFDSGLDPVSGTVYVTPRYLNVPAP